MATEINKKHFQVQKWLEEKFKGEDVPLYEISEENINYLWNLCKLNKELDQVMQFFNEDILHKINEYKKEADRLREILDGTGLPIVVLSNAGRTSLKAIADMGLALNLKDTNTSSYYLAMNDLTTEINKLAMMVEKKRKDIELLQTRTSTLKKTVSNLLNAAQQMEEHSAIDEPVSEKRKLECINFQKKTQNYVTQIKERTEPTGNKKIHHETLLKLSEELNKLKQELKPLSSKFRAYRSLPPDMQLAKVKVEEAKRELKKLENELQTDIDVLATIKL